MDYNLLAELVLPEVTKTPEYYLNLYPKRNLPEGAQVTRYAPSPTGFQHVGSVFASLISERMAHLSNGVLYLRIEDTDKKREVEGAIEDTIKTLSYFGINFDEGMVDSLHEKGAYGPYKQSDRMEIYQTFVKSLVRRGLAYPCFCTEEELDEIRKRQTEIKANPGYYGEWTRCRDLSLEEVKDRIERGTPYIIRLKSPGDPSRRVVLKDLIRGEISFPENDQDVVIMKSDGLPTYHFAHAVDDYLMGTTIVIRGEEWLPSVPVHLQLFDVLGFDLPNFAHIPTIMKLDGSSKRKLSKRKDPEAAVEYYITQGYPPQSLTEYLINLMNSNFEVWRNENPNEPYTSFEVRFDRMSESGALFDLVKLNNISMNVIASFKASKVYDMYLDWAEKYDTEMAELLMKDPGYVKRIFNIDRETPKPRKDIAKWADVRDYIGYYFDNLFNSIVSEGYNFPERVPFDEAKVLLERYAKVYDPKDDKDIWFSKVKDLASSMGYAADNKAFKKNPELFKGNVADVASAIRVAMTNKTNTPDLYEIMQIMGYERVLERLNL